MCLGATFAVLKHPCNCLKCGRFIWAMRSLTNYSCNVKTIHTCIYQGRFAARYRPLPLYTLACLCTHRYTVQVCLCSWSGNDAGAEVTAGHCWHQVRQQISSGCTTQYFGFITQQMLECAIQVAKADKLNSSYLAQGTSLSYVSGTICALLSLVLRHHFLILLCLGFFSVHLFWVLLCWIRQQESLEIHPHFK